jgi:predicted transcriptional regulator YheO
MWLGNHPPHNIMPMSNKQNDAYLEALFDQLETARELGNREKELQILKELEDSGLLTEEELNKL